MSSSTTNVKVGVCKVTFNSVDLGYTKGGVEFDVQTDSFEVTVDQLGNTPISEYVNGRKVTIKIPLAETTLDNLVAIMPGATLITDGITPTKKRVDVPTGVGSDLLTLAKAMKLHPISLPDADVSEDINIPLAMTSGAVKFAYKLDQERIFDVMFKAYPDAQGKLFSFGDPTATP